MCDVLVDSRSFFSAKRGFFQCEGLTRRVGVVAISHQKARLSMMDVGAALRLASASPSQLGFLLFFSSLKELPIVE